MGCLGRSSLFLICLSPCLLVCLSPCLSAQQEEKETKQGEKEKATAARPLDSFKAPAGAIFVIGKEFRDAIGFDPEMFVLKKKDYEVLMERIAQLERLLQSGKPQAPSVCKISGQIDGDHVYLRIRYEFATTRARTPVALGAQGAWPVGCTMDNGELPLLTAPAAAGGLATEDGLVVRVEKPGNHVLTLDVEMLPENKGDERSISLGLPRAAITKLEQFQVPVGVTTVRVNSDPLRALTQPGPTGPASSSSSRRWVQTVPLDGEHRGLSAVALGAAERLELTWKGAAAATAEALLTAEGRRWDVHVDETSVLTEVTLILQARRGRAKRWQLQLPSQAQVEVKEPLETDERIQKIDLTEKQGGNGSEAGRSTLTIELKETSAEPLRVVLQVRQTWTDGRVAIGPYFVDGAFRQWGIIRVTEPPDLRLRYHPQGDVKRREISSEQQGENYAAEFAYWSPSTASPSAPEAPGGKAVAPLVLEAVKGTVETRVDHELRWTPGTNAAGLGPNAPARGWRAVSKIRVTPNRTSVDRVDVKIPPDYGYDKEVGATSNNAVIDEVVVDSANGVAQIRLQKQSRPFTIQLPAFYPVVEGAQQSSLELPVPLQSLDRGGQVTATLPAEGWDFTPQESPRIGYASGSGEEILRGEHEHTWHFERAPPRIDLAWRPFRPELEVHSVVDVTLAGSKTRVQQELQIRSAQSPPSLVHLQIPERLAGLVQVIQGGKLKPETSQVVLAKSEDKTRTLVLEYSFPLASPPSTPHPFPLPPKRVERGEESPALFEPPGNQNPVEVPFVRLAEATRTENKVRIWTESGVLPSVDQGSWEEAPTEVVTGKDALPSLVIRSGNMENALQLRLTELPGTRPASTIIPRALIQVAIDDPGQIYQARFLVTQLHARRLEMSLPFPISQLNLTALVNGQRIQYLPFRDEYHFRVELEPAIYSKPVLLEFQYRIAAELLSERTQWRSKVYAPAFSSNVFIDRVRWQVTCPSTWVSLLHDFGQTWDAKWVWEDGLLTPRSGLTYGDLDRWLTGSAAQGESRQAEVNETQVEFSGDLTPALVFGRSSLASPGIVHVWRPLWLMACSLVVVVVCLGLFFVARAPRSRGLLWITVMSLALVGLAGALLWPGIVPGVIYGCEPGAIVVLALLSVQWLIHQRYRRQVVFLPGFTRLKAGSSIIRANAAARSREPTTVDAPAKPASEHSNSGS
jgi:hypothetical protein